MQPKYALKKLFRLFGLEVQGYVPSATDLPRMLLKYGVDAVFDVGAHSGQSAARLRALGYRGKIVSFEPVRYLFERLEQRAAGDDQWHVENVALGRVEGEAEINVSGGHGGASSILEMTQNVVTHAPDQQVIRKEKVKIATLSSMLAKHYPQGNCCFIKLDVQGAEKDVLEGARNDMERVVGVKVELSLIENYKGEALLLEMLPFLNRMGMRVVSFENGWANTRTGELFQVDCTCFRTDKYNPNRHA